MVPPPCFLPTLKLGSFWTSGFEFFIQTSSQPSTNSRDVNFSISLLTLEKLLTSFLNLTLQYQPFLKHFHSGGQWGECVSHAHVSTERGTSTPLPGQKYMTETLLSLSILPSFLLEIAVTFSGWWGWGGVFSRGGWGGSNNYCSPSEQTGLPKQQICGSGLWPIFWEVVYPKLFNRKRYLEFQQSLRSLHILQRDCQKQCCFHYSDWVLCLSLIWIWTQRGTSLCLIVTIIVCNTRCFGFNIG